MHGSWFPNLQKKHGFPIESGGCDFRNTRKRQISIGGKRARFPIKSVVASASAEATLLYIGHESVRLGRRWKHGVPSGVAVRFWVGKTGQDRKNMKQLTTMFGIEG